MSEKDLIDLFYAANELLSAYVMNFISIMSGYLLATYFLGSKLSKFQFAILTTSYTIVMLITITAIYSRLAEIEFIISDLDSMEIPSSPYYYMPETEIVLIPAHFAILAGSIYFGFSARRKN
jgi:hypothetical protein